MPAQTTKSEFIIPDGTKANIKADGDVSYSDMGIIMSDVAAVVNWTQNRIETANKNVIKNNKDYLVNATFSMASIDPDVIEKMSNGAIEKVVTAASPVATIPDQDIALGWADNTSYELVMETSSTDDTKLKMDTQPVLDTVTLDPTGTPEVLVEDADYVVVINTSYRSGYGIQFLSANMDTVSPTTYAIEIVYDTNTPRASTTLHMGQTSVTAVPFELQLVHTDDDGLQRDLYLHSTTSDSGGLSFGFKSVNDAGLETIEVAMTAEIDTELTSGRQLMSWVIDEGVTSS